LSKEFNYFIIELFGRIVLYQRTIYIVIGSISFEKDYLSGKYGGIPIVGDLPRLFNTQEE
jgi:hypothetical protein